MSMRVDTESINRGVLEYAASLDSKPTVRLSDFDPSRTVLLVVDAINGFTREGALASPRVGRIVPNVRSLMQRATAHGMGTVAFADCHHEGSTEFESFPPHCLEGTSESMLVDELRNLEYTLVEKNSTNGFHAPGFTRFLEEHPTLDTFVVCGDCTDICVLNLCLTLKTYHDQWDRACNVYVPMDSVETYDAPSHPAELMNLVALRLMEGSGVRVVSAVV